MPVIYSTEQLKRMYERLLLKYPDSDVIIIKNSVMAFAFKASARAIYRVQYPGQRPRDQITLAATSIQNTVDRLMAVGLTVGVCDLDEELPNLVASSPLTARAH